MWSHEDCQHGLTTFSHKLASQMFPYCMCSALSPAEDHVVTPSPVSLHYSLGRCLYYWIRKDKRKYDSLCGFPEVEKIILETHQVKEPWIRQKWVILHGELQMSPNIRSNKGVFLKVFFPTFGNSQWKSSHRRVIYSHKDCWKVSPIFSRKLPTQRFLYMFSFVSNERSSYCHSKP